jgi:hypothetical protein
MPIRIKLHAKPSLQRRSKPKHTTQSLRPDIPIVTPSRVGIPKPRIPREPDYSKDEDRILYEEQQVSRVEKMMMQGYRDRLALAKLLDVPPPIMDDYMRRARARWEIEGGQKHFTEYRGEALVRLRRLEQMLWEHLEALREERDSKGVQKRIATGDLLAIIREIRETSRQRADMLGLTKEMIERLMETEAEANLNFKRNADVFERGTRVAARILDIVEERMAEERRIARARIIEHEPADASQSD